LGLFVFDKRIQGETVVNDSLICIDSCITQCVVNVCSLLSKVVIDSLTLLSY
jgi:hypothetical protein